MSELKFNEFQQQRLEKAFINKTQWQRSTRKEAEHH